MRPPRWAALLRRAPTVSRVLCDGVGSESEGTILGAAVVVGAAGRGGVRSPAGTLRGLHRRCVRGGSAGRGHLAHALPKMRCGVGVVQRVDDVAEDVLQGVGLEPERGDGCIDEDGGRYLRPVDLVSGARRNLLQVEAARAPVALEVGMDHEQPGEGLIECIHELAARHTLEACGVSEVVVHEREEPVDVFRIREAAIAFESGDDSRTASPFVDVLEDPAVQGVIVAGGEGLGDVAGVVDELRGADGGEAAFDAFEFLGVMDLSPAGGRVVEDVAQALLVLAGPPVVAPVLEQGHRVPPGSAVRGGVLLVHERERGARVEFSGGDAFEDVHLRSGDVLSFDGPGRADVRKLCPLRGGERGARGGGHDQLLGFYSTARY